jgi:uncharacterized protein (TIGR02246 family)
MNRCKRMGLPACVSAAMFLLALMALPPAAGSRGLGCVDVTEDQIKELFKQWNAALQAAPNPERVAALYAENAVLLPTVQNGPLTNRGAIKGYFAERFLPDKPSGTIDEPTRTIRIGCNVAFDVGLYTFTYKPPPPRPPKDPTKARYTYIYEYDGGRWLITHHHSSKQPE